jgi:hypothetical protein
MYFPPERLDIDLQTIKTKFFVYST